MGGQINIGRLGEVTDLADDAMRGHGPPKQMGGMPTSDEKQKRGKARRKVGRDSKNFVPAAVPVLSRANAVDSSSPSLSCRPQHPWLHACLRLGILIRVSALLLLSEFDPVRSSRLSLHVFLLYRHSKLPPVRVLFAHPVESANQHGPKHCGSGRLFPPQPD